MSEVVSEIFLLLFISSGFHLKTADYVISYAKQMFYIALVKLAVLPPSVSKELGAMSSGEDHSGMPPGNPLTLERKGRACWTGVSDRRARLLAWDLRRQAGALLLYFKKLQKPRFGNWKDQGKKGLLLVF